MSLRQRIEQQSVVVLGVENARLASLKRSVSPEWDSLKHIELMMAVEEILAIRFSEVDFVNVNTIGDLVEIAEQKARESRL